MKDLLLKYIGKKITLVLKRQGTEFFIDCMIDAVGKESIQINYKDGIQIIPFDSILRIEVKRGD